MVQTEPGAIVPLFKATESVPLAAVTDAEEPQPVNVGEAGLATKAFAGKESVIPAPVRVTFELLVIVMDNRLVPPAQIALGLKDLFTSISLTFRVALAGSRFVKLIPPGPLAANRFGGMVFTQFPEAAEVTLTDTVQDAGVGVVLGGTVPPLREMIDEPVVAVTVPPQLFDATLTTLICDGMSSCQDVFVNENAFELKTVIRRSDVPPAAIEIGKNVLLISVWSEICPCAYTVCAGAPKTETISTTTKRETIDLRMFVLYEIE